MTDNVKEKVCPGCLTKQTLRFNTSHKKWIWKDHYLETSKKKRKCPYSGTDRAS